MLWEFSRNARRFLLRHTHPSSYSQSVELEHSSGGDEGYNVSLWLCIWAVLRMTVKRLIRQWHLTLSVVLGLTVSVALAVSIPVYADAAYYRVLTYELAGPFRDQASHGLAETRPPLAFLFRYRGSKYRDTRLEDIRALDEYLSGPAGGALRLPHLFSVRCLRTPLFPLIARDGAVYRAGGEGEEGGEGGGVQLAWVEFVSITGLEDHIDILEGDLPVIAASVPGSAVEVLVSEALATELGLQVGEVYRAIDQSWQEGRHTELPVRIAGVWGPRDPREVFWPIHPDGLMRAALVPEGTFQGRIASTLDNDVYDALWYLVFDGSDVYARDVRPLLDQVDQVVRQASLLGAKLTRSPMPSLQRYRSGARTLTVLLYVSGVPIMGLILTFIGLVAELSAAQRRNEIALLRSRGATAAQVAGMTIVEAAVLGLVALAIGLPAGEMVALLVTRSRSFLDFALRPAVRMAVMPTTLGIGAAASGLALLAQFAPTLQSVGHTIVTYKQEQARTLRRPWWQRACLDLLLFVPATYGVYLLRQQGSFAFSAPTGGKDAFISPLQNPLFLLVPSLGALALALVFLRTFPVLMCAVSWIASRMGTVGALLAARHLCRTFGAYAPPMMLLVLTLGHSVFTASLAQTLDHHLYDRLYYQAGADLFLSKPDTGGMEVLPRPVGEPDGRALEDQDPAGWLFHPATDYLAVSGVEAAARVGRYQAIANLGGEVQGGTFIGIDRLDFPRVAYWRQDFSSASLGELMNALALTPGGVLVPRDFMVRHALSTGDRLFFKVMTEGQINELSVQIAGAFELFPTWYPENEDGEYRPAFVGNLDYLFEHAGGRVPYEVWLKTHPGADYGQIVEDLRSAHLGVSYWRAPRLEAIQEQQRPERQGLFGVLSAGFLVAVLLTVVGFLLYELFSFRRRYVELGVLRAVGLSVGQMTAFLACELAFLILAGVAVGTGLGVWGSYLFIPYLQVGARASARIPPYTVEVAWPIIFRIYALLGLLFSVTLAGLTVLLLHMKVFEALKLGEVV